MTPDVGYVGETGWSLGDGVRGVECEEEIWCAWSVRGSLEAGVRTGHEKERGWHCSGHVRTGYCHAMAGRGHVMAGCVHVLAGCGHTMAGCEQASDSVKGWGSENAFVVAFWLYLSPCC